MTGARRRRAMAGVAAALAVVGAAVVPGVVGAEEPPDTSPPTAPRDLTAGVVADGDVELVWEAAADDVGVTGYQVFRNGVHIGDTAYTVFTVPAPDAGSHWFQVRARDAAGNESVKTPPAFIDNEPPTIPPNFWASLNPDRSVFVSWSASSDNVEGPGSELTYRVLRNGVEIGSTPDLGVDEPPLPAGSYWYQAVAVDAAGNESRRTAPVRVDIAPVDDEPPSVPQNLTVTTDAAFGDLYLTWDESTDNVGVFYYEILANGEVISGAGQSGVTLDWPGGNSQWFQVRAVDFEGNRSAKTPPVRIDLPDETPPTAPRNLEAVVTADGAVELTWDAATDNVGVVVYQVLRNGVPIWHTASTAFTFSEPGAGSHWFQVVARDAAGNEGNRTAPVRVDID